MSARKKNKYRRLPALPKALPKAAPAAAPAPVAKICGTCRHWDQVSDAFLDADRGACRAICEGGPAGSAGLDRPATLVTQGTFGCALHLPKEAP